MAEHQSPAPDAFLTTPELADHYRTTVATVRYWRHRGYGPRGVSVGAHVLYPVAEVRKFDAELLQAAQAATA